MATPLKSLLLPAIITIAGVAVAWFAGTRIPALHIAGLTIASLSGTLFALRLLDRLVWHGWYERGGRRAPPRLLTDLFAAVVMIAAVMVLAGALFGLPIAGLITTSGVLVAVIGFALRDMLASLFSGIALNIEHPFRLGDWIGLDTGEVGQVIEVSWLTTQIRTKDRVIVIVPNAELATRRFKNYGSAGTAFRSEIEVTVDHALPTQKVERLLTAAVRSVPAANLTSRQPDLKIKEFGERGLIWLVRFWVDDYEQLVETRYKVQRAVLRHLHLAGVPLPYQIMDIYSARMPSRLLDLTQHREQVIKRADLFRELSSEDLSDLATSAIERIFKIDAVVTEEGETTRSLYIVLEGFLEVTVDQGNGRRLQVNQLAPGAFFGEFSLLTGAPRSARVETRSESVLLEITVEALEPILRRCPAMADHLARVLAARQSMTQQARSMSDAETGRQQQERQLLGKIRSLFGL